MKTRLGVLTIIVVLFATSFACAEIIRYDFTVQVQESVFPTADSYSGYFSYDTATPDVPGLGAEDLDLAAGTRYNILGGHFIAFDIQNYTISPASFVGALEVINDLDIGDPTDPDIGEYLIDALWLDMDNDGFPGFDVGFDIFFFAPSELFDSDSLPGASLTIADFPSTINDTDANIALFASYNGMIVGGGEMTYLSGSIIPEPASILLFGVGLVGLVGSRHRSRGKGAKT